MDLIRPELSELFALEFGEKMLNKNNELVFTTAKKTDKCIVKNKDFKQSVQQNSTTIQKSTSQNLQGHQSADHSTKSEKSHSTSNKAETNTKKKSTLDAENPPKTSEPRASKKTYAGAVLIGAQEGRFLKSLQIKIDELAKAVAKLIDD